MKHYPVHHCSDPKSNWSMAEVMTDFTFAWENKPTPKTEFRALWNQQEFHFRFDCQDDDLVLADGTTIKERALGSDRVEIFFAPDLSLNPYYCLEMTPRGDALAYQAKFYREIDWNWRCLGLHLEVEIQSDHYTVSGFIPLSTLIELNVLKPRARDFKVGVYRAEFSRDAEGSVHSGWMPWVNPHTDKPDFHVPSSFGVFNLIGGSV